MCPVQSELKGAGRQPLRSAQALRARLEKHSCDSGESMMLRFALMIHHSDARTQGLRRTGLEAGMSVRDRWQKPRADDLSQCRGSKDRRQAVALRATGSLGEARLTAHMGAVPSSLAGVTTDPRQQVSNRKSLTESCSGAATIS